MKKIITVLCAVILCVAALVGCADKELAKAQDELIDQLGYSYYNEILIVNRDLGKGHRVYYIFGFDDKDKINELVICRFFTDEKTYESYKSSVEIRAEDKECTLRMDEEDALMIAYNDTLELADSKGLTFSEAKEKFVSGGWTYVMKQLDTSAGTAAAE